ncbi:MAG: hypothetical protein EOO70_05090, partial [Myxococcaceae bacterium]
MVRTFPSAPRQRAQWLVAIVMALALAALSAAVVPAMADDLRQKEKKVGKAIKRAANDVHASSKQLSQARARLSRAQQQLGVAQGAYRRTQAQLTTARAHNAKMQAALTAANARLAKSRAELKAAELQVTSQRSEMAAVVASNYQQGNPELIGLAAMLTSGNPKEITSQVNTVHNLMNRQAAMLDALKAAEARAEALERTVYKQRETVAEK